MGVGCLASASSVQFLPWLYFFSEFKRWAESRPSQLFLSEFCFGFRVESRDFLDTKEKGYARYTPGVYYAHIENFYVSRCVQCWRNEVPKLAKKSVAEWSPGGAGRKAMPVAGATNPNLAVPHFPMTLDRQERFLKNLAVTGNITTASLLTDGSNGSARSYKRLAANDHAFKQRLDDALETFASKVAEVLNEEFFAGSTNYVVSGGAIMTHPVSGEPLTQRKRDAKIVLAMARRYDAAMRDTKIQVNVDGSLAHDPVNNPRIVIELADLHRLDLTDQALLISLAKKVYQNRVEEWSGPEMRTISDEIDGEFTEETEGDNPYDI